MKHADKNYFFILLLAGCFLAPSGSLFAQSRYLKQAAQKALETAGSTKALTAEQFFLKENQLLAFQQVRRALVRMPGILQDKEFKPQLDLLKQLGIYIPEGADEKTVFDILSQNIAPLSQQTQQLVFPLSFPARSAKKQFLFLRDNEQHINRFQEAFLNGQKHLSWQTPGRQSVSMGPTKFPVNPQHPLYACGVTAKEISQGKYSSLSQVFDKIFNTNLTTQQKLALSRHVAKTAELAGPDLTLLYINMLHEIPAVKMDGWVPPAMGKELLTYLRHKEALLIEPLKEGKTWSEEQANLFLDLASLLPAEESGAVLGALTYLDPSTAQWLLLNPNETVRRSAIEEKLKQARSAGLRFPKAPLSAQANRQVIQAHLELLRHWDTAYTDILNNIKQRIGAIEFLQQQEKNKPNTVMNTPLALSKKLYVKAYYMRLKKLHNVVWNHLENIEAELNSLEALSPKIAN